MDAHMRDPAVDIHLTAADITQMHDDWVAVSNVVGHVLVVRHRVTARGKNCGGSRAHTERGYGDPSSAGTRGTAQHGPARHGPWTVIGERRVDRSGSVV